MASKVYQPVEVEGRSYGSLVWIGQSGRYLEMGGDSVTLPQNMALCELVEVDAAPTPTVPLDHEATIKQALHWMRDDGRHIRLAYGRDFHDDVMARIDTALAWLEPAQGKDTP